MTEGQKPDDKAEIEGILADLESILSEKAPEEAKPEVDPGIANIVASLGAALKQTPGAPPPSPKVPPASKPPDVPPAAQPPSAAKPPAPSPPQRPPEVKLPSRPPQGQAVVPPAAPPAPSRPPAQAPPPAPVPSQSSVEKTQVIQPPVQPAPQQPPAASPLGGLGSIPPPMTFPPGAVDEVPADAPKDQIRRVAFLYAAEQKQPFVEFIRFVDSLALHFSKKPLYLRKVYMAEISPNSDLQAAADRMKAAGAVGAVGVLPGIPESGLRSLEANLTAANISYYWLTPEEAFKRPVVLGLVVELMLLSTE